MWQVAERIGQIAAGVLAVAVLSILVALATAAWVSRGYWAPGKRFSIFVLDFLYLPLKILFDRFDRAQAFDAMMVKLKNRVNRRRFAAARRRIVLAPTCLRDLECPAISTRRGIQCTQCGRCKVGAMKAEAESLGYGYYLLTGSSFVVQIVKDERPDAALLVACPYECNKVMMALGRLTAYAVPLDRDGCVSTEVTLERVSAALRIGLGRESVPEAAQA